MANADVQRAARRLAKKLAPALAAEPSRASRDIFATVQLGEGGQAFALLDGADEPTPVTPAVGVHHGDRVIVHIVDHRCVVTQNLTVPSINDAGYEHVKDIAEEANELLDGVAGAAAAADKTVAEMLADADAASALVSDMERAADTAGTTLAQIVADADSAAGTLAEMAEAALAADTTLTQIYEDATAAGVAAASANRSATSALTQLSIVEDVAGTLSWIREHGTFVPSDDTRVVPGTVYFFIDGGDYSPVVQPTGNPAVQGWYVLDVTDSQSEFIMAHIAVTARGLWILPNGIDHLSATVVVDGSGRTVVDGSGRELLAMERDVLYSSGYKTLFSNTGMTIYDGTGTAVATYADDGIGFDAGRVFTIGNEDAYIVFRPASGTTPASITIGGANIHLGTSKTLSELLSDIDNAVEAAETALDSATLAITSTNGQLFKNGAESTVLQVAVFPNGGGRLDTIAEVRERFGPGAYIEWKYRSEGGSWATMASNDPHLSQGGMWLTVTPDDVDVKTSFSASLVVQ